MNRFEGFIVALLYIAGGTLTGYYAYKFRLAYEMEGITMDWLALLAVTPHMFLGIVALFIAVALQVTMIASARYVDRQHCSYEARIKAQLAETQDTLKKKDAQMEWVEQAIARQIQFDRESHNQTETHNALVPREEQ